MGYIVVVLGKLFIRINRRLKHMNTTSLKKNKRFGSFLSRQQKSVQQTKSNLVTVAFKVNKGAPKPVNGYGTGEDLHEFLRLTPEDESITYTLPSLINRRGEPEQGYVMETLTLAEIFRKHYGNRPGEESNPIHVSIRNLDQVFMHTRNPEQIEEAVRAMVVINCGGIVGKRFKLIAQTDPYFNEIVWLRSNGFGRSLDENERIPVYNEDGSYNPNAVVEYSMKLCKDLGLKHTTRIQTGTEMYQDSYIDQNGKKKYRLLHWKYTINLQMEFIKLRNFVTGVGEANITGKYDMSGIVKELTRVAILCAKHHQPFGSMIFKMYRKTTEIERVGHDKRKTLSENRNSKRVDKSGVVVLKLDTESEAKLQNLERAWEMQRYKIAMSKYSGQIESGVNEMLGLPSSNAPRLPERIDYEPDIDQDFFEDNDAIAPEPIAEPIEIEGEIVDQKDWLTKANMVKANSCQKTNELKKLIMMLTKLNFQDVTKLLTDTTSKHLKSRNANTVPRGDSDGHFVTAFTLAMCKHYNIPDEGMIEKAFALLLS